MLKAIHAQESRAAAGEKVLVVPGHLGCQKMGKAAGLVEHSIGETLTFYGFPDDLPMVINAFQVIAM